MMATEPAIGHSEDGLDSEFAPIVQDMLAVLVQVPPVETAYVTRLEPGREYQTVSQIAYRGEPLVAEGQCCRWDDSICARALASGEAFVGDVAERWPDCEIARRLGVRTYVGVALYDGSGTLFGTLCGVSRQASRDDEGAIQQTFERVGRLFTSRLAGKAREQASEQRAAYAELLAAEMTFLHRIGDLSLNASDLRSAVTEFARLKNERGNWDRAVPFHRRDGSMAAGWDIDAPIVAHADDMLTEQLEQMLEREEGLHGHAVVLEPQRPALDRLRAAAGFGAEGTTVLVTVATTTRLEAGVLLLKHRPTTVADGEARLLANCSDYLSLLADRLHYVEELRQANERLTHIARHDALTGLKNRRCLLEDLGRMLAQAERLGETIHVVFIDLDGFKTINDTYGHDAGDQFLAAFAQRLKVTTRGSDVIARYGGDEFVVVAPAHYRATPEAERARLAERIHEQTRGTYKLAECVLDYAGASVGVVTNEAGETDPDTLLARADAAMYQVKQRRKADTGAAR